MSGSRRQENATKSRLVYGAATLLALCALIAGCRDDRDPPRDVPGGDAARGREAIVAYGCGGCHTIPGVRAATGRVGPPLSDYAERGFVAGVLPNDATSLVRWIRDPQSVTPGTAMPNLGVSEDAARHIAAYLYTLRRGRLGAPRLLPPSVLPGH